MGFRFKKSIKIAPGVKANIGKKSAGLSFGTKGAHYSVNSSGKEAVSVGVPGTGVSYSSSRGGNGGKSKGKGGCMLLVIPIILVLFVAGGIKSCVDGDSSTTTEVLTTISTTSIDSLFVVEDTTAKAETTSDPEKTSKKETTTEKKETTTDEKETTTEERETTTKKSISRTVYRTPSGKKYHFDPDCGGKNSYAVSLDDAKDSGLTPCNKCAK